LFHQEFLMLSLPYSRTATDERGLWATVLQLAVADLTSANPRLWRPARAWFESTKHGPGSFIWICDHLEINASWIRRQVFETAEQNARRDYGQEFLVEARRLSA
jgi:hypothetical protein